jgi:hypothetical protein
MKPSETGSAHSHKLLRCVCKPLGCISAHVFMCRAVRHTQHSITIMPPFVWLLLLASSFAPFSPPPPFSALVLLCDARSYILYQNPFRDSNLLFATPLTRLSILTHFSCTQQMAAAAVAPASAAASASASEVVVEKGCESYVVSRCFVCFTTTLCVSGQAACA